MFTQEYLEDLSHAETPPRRTLYWEEREELSKNYCDLRNIAKNLLKRPDDKRTEDKLIRLIKKLGLEE